MMRPPHMPRITPPPQRNAKSDCNKHGRGGERAKPNNTQQQQNITATAESTSITKTLRATIYQVKEAVLLWILLLLLYKEFTISYPEDLKGVGCSFYDCTEPPLLSYKKNSRGIISNHNKYRII